MAAIKSQSGGVNHPDSTDLEIKLVIKDKAGSKTCKVCQQLLTALRADRATVHKSKNLRLILDLGTLEDVVQPSSCKFHAPLLHTVLDRDKRKLPPSEPNPHLFAHVDASEVVTVIHVQDSNGAFLYRSGPIRLMHSEPLEMMKSARENPDSRFCRTIDPSWIDNHLLIRWKQICRCRYFLRKLPFEDEILHPKLLIDVEQNCIIHATADHPYVALSYTWDKTKCLALKENIAELQEPGALESRRSQLSKTIRIAMEIVKILKERYLWADQLCIVQDDDEQKWEEIQKMAAIYGQSILTIIGAHNKEYGVGIKGIRGVSKPRNHPQHSFPIGESDFVLWPQVDSHRFAPDWSRYHNRGWTYQENLLSRRRLIFEKETVRWDCACATICEGLSARSPHLDQRNGTWLRHALDDRWIGLKEAPNLISYYATRDFTCEEDALPALGGILSALRLSYPGGFISGLPCDSLDLALLWRPCAATTCVRRKPYKASATPPACLPSWSWIGWKCRLFGPEHDGPLHDTYFAKDRPSTFRQWKRENFTPLVDWHTQETTKTLGQSVSCRWTEAIQRFTNSLTEPLPQGWSRHEIPPADREGWPDAPLFLSLTDNTPACYYTHDEQTEWEFWYPLPLLRIGERPKQNLAIRYLSCKTRRAYLYGGPFVRKKEPAKWTEVFDIYLHANETDSEPVGILTLHDRPTQPVIMEAFTSITGHRFELVEIGKGFDITGERLHSRLAQGADDEAAEDSSQSSSSSDDDGDLVTSDAEQSSDDDDDDDDCSITPPTLYEYYHVLYVEWRNGVAYRKGIGEVDAEAWEKLDREAVDLMLG